MDNKQWFMDQFTEVFSNQEGQPIRTFFSPGRINLIGEHTDYNGGHVLPCAITLGTYGAARVRSDRMVRLYSKNFPKNGVIQFSLGDLNFDREQGWANYPKGMIRFIEEKGSTFPFGLDLFVYGNLPNGAGLSSSASLELLVGVILNEMFDLGLKMIDLIQIAKKVENDFIGVNSGIMDQFAIGMGKEDKAILLDCNTLKFEYAPISLDHYQIIIMNTNKRRELADSKYNERRSECESALSHLQKELDIQTLGDLSESEFERHNHLIPNPILRKRAKHAVYENQRTIKALSELRQGHLEAFGRLMNESHISLRDDYEVTGVELDTLVEAAWDQNGTLGARMTGAGFGGCAIALVENGQIDAFIENVGQIYKDKMGYEADFYVANIGDGVKADVPFDPQTLSKVC
jgi:galactokinase